MRALPAGGAILARLKALGVEYAFCNSGTDFPPVAEGIAAAESMGIPLPETVVAPHEHAAMGMAHGYALLTGRGQAVMLHTNVGLANGAIGAINAACDRIPLLLMSGRTPISEAGRFGSRTVPIGWGQEMRDQAALVREACKWEHELRFPETTGSLVDRAHAIAHSTPEGPVYLALPREPLCETVPADGLGEPATIAPSRAAAEPAAIETAARWLREADAPLVVAQHGAGDAAAFEAFDAFARAWGVAVCSYWATRLAVSTEHPCHVGPDPGPWLAKADLVLVVDSLAPWSPDAHRLRANARVVHLGPDPLFSRFPTRNFPSHLSIAGDTGPTLRALVDATGAAPDSAAPRRQALAAASRARREAEREAADPARGLTKEFVSARLGARLSGMSSSVFSELGCRLGPLVRTEHGSWFQEPFSGGLGWSFPAAMGAKLADPDRVSVAAMGDGSYVFANPTACHQIAESTGLPVLVLVLNNGEWGAVRESVVGLYPDGHAARTNEVPLTALRPSPDFVKTAEASRAFARRVDTPEDLDGALGEALDAVRREGRQALLDVRLAQS